MGPTGLPYGQQAAVDRQLVIHVARLQSLGTGHRRNVGQRDPSQRREHVSPLVGEAIDVAAAAAPGAAVQGLGSVPPTPCDAAAAGRSRRCGGWRSQRPGRGPAPRSAADGCKAGAGPEAAGTRRGPASRGREPPGAPGMAQSPDLPGLGTPRESTTCGSEMPGVGGMAQAPDRSRLGPYGESTVRGREVPEVVVIVQSPDLPELGHRGNRQPEDWGRRGSWAWRSHRICEGSDPTGIFSSRIGDARGRGHGAVAGAARAWTPWEIGA